ncbi:MAG: T9SS type A sorting domain-containing protein [Nonlabens sp.]|uniref:PKD-like domain-containing protein n=1 Tax=Nonlabens sp. TaxID=1888209 RepID=UPI0035A66DA6
MSIGTHPATTQTVCSGTSASFNVLATGTGLSYQWRKGTTDLTDGGTISGATTATLTINPTISGDAASDYNVIITGTAPCTPLTSNNATLVINQAVSIITQPPATQTLCSGGTATLSVNATGAGLVYQWRKGSTNLVNGANIAGANSSTLTLSNLQTTDTSNDYNVVITGVSPCTPLTSNNSILIINRLVTINTQPSNVGVCVSNPATFGIVASGDGLTFQWYKGIIGSGVAVVNSANITGASSNVLNFAQAALTDDGPYYAIVSGIAPCSAITSNQVTLNVDQSIAITSQPISKTVCEDTPNVSFSVTANAGGDPLTYQWRKNSVNIVGATASTFMISTATLTSAGNYDVVISGPSGYTCTSIQSAAAILTINPKPIGSATTQSICSGSSTNVALNSTVSGTTFSWIAAIQTSPTGGTITGFSDSSGTSITQALTNTGTTAGTIRYTVTPTANSCIGITFTIDVTVNPAPVGSATAQTICSGSTTNVVLNSTVTGTTYSWTAAIQTSPTAGTITGFSNGTQNTIAQSLSNTGTTVGIIRYTVTPTANSCTGTAFTVDVTVNPNSTIVLSSVSGSDNPTNCVNTVLNISYAIGGGGNNASITVGALPAGVAGSYNSGTRVFTISGTPSAVGTFSYTVTTQGLCSNASLSGSITVNSDSTINLNLGTGSDNQTKCINAPITPIKYTINNGGTNPTIAWNPGPAGFTGSYAGGVYTISGTSSVAGTYNYTITTSGTCINSSLSGTVTVNPNPTGSANVQTICSGSTTSVALNSNVSGTTFTWTAAIQSTPTGGTITGSGNSSGSSIAQTLTNTGTTSGSIRYTVTPTANSCPGSAFTVDVIVNPKPNGSAIAQTVCSGLPTNIALNSTVSGTTFTWTSAIISMPTGGTISGFNTGTTNTIAETLSNSGTTAGVIRYTVTPTANNCPGTVFTVDVTVNAPTVGGTTTITSTTNPSNVDNGTNKLTDCHSSGGVIRLNGNVGTVVRWETSTNAGGTWIPRGNAGNLTYNYTGITAATIFRAVIQNSSCTIVNSGNSILFIIPNIKPSPVSAIPSTICEGESTQLTSDSGFSSSQNLASGGLFNTANPAGWLVDDKIFPASGDNGVNNEFSETNGNAGDEYDSGDGKFAITRGNRTSVMQTPVFDLIGLTSANLTFDHAYKLDAVNDYAEVKISLDGGLTYTVTLATFNGNTSIKNPFKNSNPANSISLNLNAYLGYSNIKIGFFFYGTVNAAGNKIPNIGSTWAIDNVKIPQAPNPLLTSQWKNLNTDTIISVTNTTRVTVTPPVTTTYEVTSFLNGCTSYGAEGTTYVTVTVNKRPTANIGPDQTICYDGTATFSVTLTGVAPWTITYTNGTTPTTVTGINTSPYIFNVPNIKADVTYTLTALNDKNCTSFLGGITGSAKVKVLLGRAGWWTGLMSTDWFDCKNWEQGLPSFTIDANILPTIANGNRLPIIDKTSPYAIPYSGIASAKDMIINTNGSVTMVSTNNSELQISGNWRNSGAFIPGTGTVTFNGATVNQVQTVNLDIKTNETFFNLTTNNTGDAKGISVVDKFELTVLNYVTLLSGDIRLTGEAQLVQAGIAANPAGGTGKLLIDQQGQKNSYNYNYWSSPVSTNNLSYSIGGVLRDGTDVTTNPFNPSSISFGDGAYFADTQNIGAIKISNRWLWSYNSLTPATNTDWQNYYQWNYIGKSGTIKIGEGYSMKGTGGKALISAIQNYVFVGKPNSGDIALAIKPQQSYLIGNPYPSALDANLFIRNNLAGCVGCTGTANVFNGALYFWDHFALSNNHLLAQYEGGYSIYTLIGGLVAIADTPLTANNNAKGTKQPLQYIPVAQGFFVQAFVNSALTTTTNIQQGYLNFKNTQRTFNRESDGTSLFMKAKGSKQVDSRLADTDMRPKITFNFITAKGINRQLLVGADPNTTNQFDIGYDAPILETKGDSFYWEFSNSKFVIQGVPNFDDDQIIPLGITVANEGVITLKISLLENISASTEIYLYDNVTNLYSTIKNNDFQIALGVGEYNKRFSLQFVNKTLSVDTNNLENGILIYYSNTKQTLNIQNNFIDAEVSTVDLYNLTGQKIAHWAIDEVKQNNIIIPITDLSTAGYIVKVKTTKGDLSKKVIIK